MLTELEVYGSRTAAPVLPVSAGGILVDPIQIRSITGLGPVKAALTTTPFAAYNGEFLTNNSVGKRNIVLTLGLNPDWADQTMSSLRQLLYAYFMVQQSVNLRFHSDDLPLVQIDGFVESFEPNIFAKDPEVQISIICPEPNFVAVEATVVTGLTSGDVAITGWPQHPVDIDYEGNTPGGFTLRITSASTGNEIIDGLTQVFVSSPFPEEFATYVAEVVPIDGALKISTVPGDKYNVRIGVDGVITSNLNSQVQDSKWVQLQPGVNTVNVIGGSSYNNPWELVYYAQFAGI